LLFNDCLYHTLICPNKPPLFGAVVNNTPWWHFNSQSKHLIEVRRDYLIILLEMNGVVLSFESHKPSDDGLEN
jgi:hypothetical protein